MTAPELLADLVGRGFTLTRGRDGKIDIYPGDRVTADEVKAIRENRPELLALLDKRENERQEQERRRQEEELLRPCARCGVAGRRHAAWCRLACKCCKVEERAPDDHLCVNCRRTTCPECDTPGGRHAQACRLACQSCDPPCRERAQGDHLCADCRRTAQIVSGMVPPGSAQPPHQVIDPSRWHSWLAEDWPPEAPPRTWPGR